MGVGVVVSGAHTLALTTTTAYSSLSSAPRQIKIEWYHEKQNYIDWRE